MNGNAGHAVEDQDGPPLLSAKRASEALNEDVHALREEVERLRRRVEDDDTVAIVRKIFALDESAKGKADEENKKTGIGEKIASACDSMWGGPVAPREDDTILSWFGNFCGGVTTAHGINRVFDEGQGPVRRIFWIVFFLASFVVLWILVDKAIKQYLQADVTTSIYSEDGSSTMPMITVCNSSPLRCGCEAFYDPVMIANHFDIVLPYVCGSVIAYKETFTGVIDAVTGKRISNRPVLEELASTEVDVEKTKQNIVAFAANPENLINCDNGPYTKEYFKSQVVAAAAGTGKLTTLDVINYAGYVSRGRLLRFCMAPDPLTGEKTNCDDDRFWSPPEISENNGACHTFNPCHGFEGKIGDPCESDEDCQHGSSKHLNGGVCTNNKCECNLCKSGSGCEVIKQSKAGRGNGVRFVLNVEVQQDAAVASAQNSRWASGASVFLHSRLDDMNAGTRLLAPPGMATDVSIGQSVFKENNFPYTNCSKMSITDSSLCHLNCVRRAQAIECCGMSDLPIALGRFNTLKAKDPVGEEIRYRNPLLGCNVLDPNLAKCFAEKTKQDSEGEICLNGATLMTEGYSKLIFSQSKTGWYETTDSNNNDIPDQEEESAAIEMQCVWPEALRLLPDGTEEPNHGRKCTEDTDCKSKRGDADTNGKCVKAYRAFCPNPCDYLKYSVRSQGVYPLSTPSVSLMASQELAWVTHHASEAPDVAVRWKPRCARDPTSNNFVDTPSCFTNEEAHAFVLENYALINLYYQDFDQTVLLRDAAIDTVTLLGTLGGNLGLCVGFSIMTIVEWMELGAFALLSMPFFYFGIKMPYIKRVNEESSPLDVLDENVAIVLKNMKSIYLEKADGNETAITAELGIHKHE